jgi:catechol 2,3-dioxygenase-like lactoylglutathione lyase family enzyme
VSSLGYVSPLFIVSKLKDSVSFYVDKLGFEVRYIGPLDDPYFAIVGRDAVSVMLKEITPEIKPIPNHTRHEWAKWDAFIYAADPDALFAEYGSREATFHQSLRDDEDGLRGFEVIDTDGYVLYFGKPIS